MSTLIDIQELFQREVTTGTVRELDIVLVYFHGSRARRRPRADSDYDFAVLLNDRVAWSFLERVERLDKFGEFLAEQLSLSRDSVDIQDLSDMPVSIAFDVVGDGFLLWEGEPDLGLYFRRQTYSRYQDFQWVETFFRESLREKLLGGRQVG